METDSSLVIAQQIAFNQDIGIVETHSHQVILEHRMFDVDLGVTTVHGAVCLPENTVFKDRLLTALKVDCAPGTGRSLWVSGLENDRFC